MYETARSVDVIDLSFCNRFAKVRDGTPRGCRPGLLVQRSMTLPLWAAIAAGAFSLLGLGVYVTRIEPYRPVLRRLTLRVPENWPQLSILHLSDLHVRARADRLYRVQERFLRSIKARPDIVCVTGDVCETLKDAHRAATLLQHLNPLMVTFVTLGNHEHDAPIPTRQRSGRWRILRLAEQWVWRVIGPIERSSGTAESQDIAAALGRTGLTVLINDGMRIDIDGRSLWVAGTDSLWSGRSRAMESLNGRRPDEPCLALIHEPEGVFPFIRRGAALILAGHTHGGQVRTPFGSAIYEHRTDRRIGVSAGLQKFGQTYLHISAGLGQNIPLRFNCPPEATWIDCIPTACPIDC